MLWKQLQGRAKEYFDYFKELPWIREHYYDALARGCLAAAKLDTFGDYDLKRIDKNGDTERRTPEAMEVRKLKAEVETMNKTFGLTPYDESKINKVLTPVRRHSGRQGRHLGRQIDQSFTQRTEKPCCLSLKLGKISSELEFRTRIHAASTVSSVLLQKPEVMPMPKKDPKIILDYGYTCIPFRKMVAGSGIIKSRPL